MANASSLPTLAQRDLSDFTREDLHDPGAQYDANFTRLPDPTTPTGSNLNYANRRRKTTASTLPPPRLNLGAGVPTNEVSRFISNQWATIDKERDLKRKVLNKFATTMDNFISTANSLEERRASRELAEQVTKYLSTAIFAQSNGTVFTPIRPLSTEETASSAKVASKSVSFADKAKGPTGSINLQATAGTAKGAARTNTSRASSRASLAALSHKSAASKRLEQRLLVTLKTEALLNRAEPYALRDALVKRIDDITMADIPSITATNTGWAITPADLTVRDLLLTQENVEIMCQVMGASSIKKPETWITYAVPNVPTSLPDLFGVRQAITQELVEREVIAQAKELPASVRPSRNGANEHTGRMTWIVSFHTYVRSFTLFNASEHSKLITKKSAPSRHEMGCQGYCNPNKCTRLPRCGNCSMTLDRHEGPSGLNCAKAPKCANCYGPFPAGHSQCPAAPKRLDGRLIKLTKKQLDAVRRIGLKAYSEKNLPSGPASQTGVTTSATTVSSIPTPSQVPSAAPGRIVAPTRKRRGEVISQHENNEELATSSSSSSSGSSSSGAHRARLARAAAPTSNMNLALLSQRSFEPSTQSNDSIDDAEQVGTPLHA